MELVESSSFLAFEIPLFDNTAIKVSSKCVMFYNENDILNFYRCQSHVFVSSMNKVYTEIYNLSILNIHLF